MSILSRISIACNRPFKVAFVGTHGTGKTTLVDALSTHLSGIGITCSVTDEVPRVVCESAADPTFFRRGNNSLARQIMLLMGQPIYETAAGAEGSSILLCDRSVLDHWAYTRYLFIQELQSQGILLPAGDFVAKHCESYDVIFYVPIEFGPVDDGTRESDASFQQAIDREICDLLKTYRLRYCTIKGTVNERIDQVLKELESRIST
jgi:nicotinamide riboside kinase